MKFFEGSRGRWIRRVHIGTYSGSQSVFTGSATSPGNWSEMKILRLHPGWTESEVLGRGAAGCVFTSPAGDSVVCTVEDR